MAHTIVGKLNKAANEIPTQNGTGFGIPLRRAVLRPRNKKERNGQIMKLLFLLVSRNKCSFIKMFW